MADIKAGADQLFLREEELRQGMEMLFFAYRQFTAGPDKVLDEFGFGRAHHRVIYFVGRNRGITVTELLGILRITKQSLARVLRDLIGKGFIVQTRDVEDKRRKPLALTGRGRELEERLTEMQRQLVGQAYREAGVEAVQGFRRVLFGLMDQEDREKFDLPAPTPTPAGRKSTAPGR